MNEATEKKHRTISGIATSIIMVLLFLLLWMYNFNIELPELSEDGSVAVAYGDPDAGGPSEVPVEPETSAAAPNSPSNEAFEQNEDPDAVATKKTNETKNKTENTNTKPVEQPKDDALDNLLKGKKNQQKQNSGDGSKPGTQGAEDGKGDSNKGGAGGGGSSTGPGGGIGGNGSVKHSFGSRRFIAGTTNETCNKQGKVVLDIIVKKDGSIVYDGVNPESNGGSCLEGVARKLLSKSKFAPTDQGFDVPGTITFIFKLN